MRPGCGWLRLACSLVDLLLDFVYALLAGSRYYFFFLSGLSDFLALSGLLSAFLADFFGSASFFLSFFSVAFESAEEAAAFLLGDAFLSFKSLLAFEASPLFFLSSLATLTTSRSMPVLAWASGIIHRLFIRRVGGWGERFKLLLGGVPGFSHYPVSQYAAVGRDGRVCDLQP